MAEGGFLRVRWLGDPDLVPHFLRWEDAARIMDAVKKAAARAAALGEVV